MKYRVATLICILFPLMSAAADWNKGQWQAKLNGDIATFNIESVLDDALIISLNWKTGVSNNLTSQAWAFTDDARKYAQTNLPDDTRIQLRLTSFGELIVDTKLNEQTRMAFLKPISDDITRIEDYPTEQAIDALPDAATWIHYAGDDLWKYWGTDTALDFDSYRCNTGKKMDPENLCYELRPSWIIAGIENQYTRMLSRQIYAYGVIFNITGSEDAFADMQAGLEILKSRLEDSGSAITVLNKGKVLYRPEQRTTQDLAYVQIGLAMGYYLTGDPTLLEHIDRIKDYVMETYYRDDWGMLAWTLEDQMPGDSENKELVAQLDQLNAYMLLVYPHLPEAMKAEWANDIHQLVDILLEQFHDKDHNRFAGQIVKGGFNDPGDRHNDFGHSVKSYWMIYIAGQLLNDEHYLEIGQWGIDKIIHQAIRFRETPEGYSNWGNQVQSNGSSWWEFAELTQATSTLALNNPDYARYLPDIYDMWLNNFVDKQFGGVWMGAGSGSKQNLWKNGYHEAEFGLVGLITSQKIKGEDVSLYFKKSDGHFQPYLYNNYSVVVTEKSSEHTKVTF